MKITSPKLAPAPTTAERPQLATPTSGNTGIVPSTPKSGNTGIVPSTPKSGNTGIVPSAPSKPEDSFQTQPTGTGSASGTSSIALPKPQSVSTYALPASLEPHRALFDKYGEHIAKLPSQVQPKAIELASGQIFRDIGGVASLDEVNKGLNDAVAYFTSRPTITNDPQYYAVADRVVDTARNHLGSVRDVARDIGRSVTRDPSLLNPRNILRNTRQPQQQQQADETRQLFRRMPRWF
jgi:hypothetical protein